MSARPLDGIDTLTDTDWREQLMGVHVDRTSVSWRVQSLWSRSLKGATQTSLTDLAVRCTDLTTLEAPDTPRRLARLTGRAVAPGEGAPPVAAVCVWSDLVGAARDQLAALPGGDRVAVAVVAGAFPSGRSLTELKALEVAAAVAAGADEVDVVLDRGAYLSGRYREAAHDLLALREACGDAHLKVILETGELGTLADVARASRLALACGADFVKTSTGKVSPAATPEVVSVMLSEVRAFERATGERRGVKAAGGIRAAKDALRYLLLVHDVAGEAWLDPALWRFGASALLDDLCAQLAHQREGRYLGPRHFPVS